MKKAIAACVISSIVCTTSAQGVYDDFIYTRKKADSTVPYQNAGPDQIRSGILDHEKELAGKIENLLKLNKCKDVVRLMQNENITLNDQDELINQTEAYRSVFPLSSKLNSQYVVGFATGKTLLYNMYMFNSPGNPDLYFRLYFNFYEQAGRITHIDIMFVRLPKYPGSAGVYDDFNNTGKQ